MKIYNSEFSTKKSKSLFLTQWGNKNKVFCLNFIVSKKSERDYDVVLFWYDGYIEQDIHKEKDIRYWIKK